MVLLLNDLVVNSKEFFERESNFFSVFLAHLKFFENFINIFLINWNSVILENADFPQKPDVVLFVGSFTFRCSEQLHEVLYKIQLFHSERLSFLIVLYDLFFLGFVEVNLIIQVYF